MSNSYESKWPQNRKIMVRNLLKRMVLDLSEIAFSVVGCLNLILKKSAHFFKGKSFTSEN